ncbi:thioredoxin family protein [uncultured Fibrella sp.]|uniref:thioredoxin family protein n=1 Tax=uncultured Fibrella sp. TaxID=1284596 RepID=UPI0035CAF7E1
MQSPLRLRPMQLALLLAFSFVTFIARAGDDPVGIRFFTGSWKEVLAEAKKQNKPIFVDIYTTWCGPCKLMAKQAFPDKTVGDLFNANFVSYQIDAEKGEGIAVAKQYTITAYPTSLFVSADGSLIQRTIGYSGIKGFLDEANKAVEAAKDPKPITVWDKEFVDGNHDATFLKGYLAKRAKLGMPNADALETYLTVVPETEWVTPDNVDAISGNLTTSNSRAFDALLKAAKDMRGNSGQAKRLQTVMQATGTALQRDERQAKTEAELDQLINNRQNMNAMLSIKPVSDLDQKSMANDIRASFYKRTKNMVRYRELTTKMGNELLAISPDSLRAKDAASYQRFVDQSKLMPDSVRSSANFLRFAANMKMVETQQMANKLNSLAWTYFETMTDPSDLNKALAWSGRSLELERNPALLDTYAQLLGKLGRKKEAIQYEEEALAKAKTAGEDVADYEKALASFKK